MREAKPEWIAALRALEGCAEADIRWNMAVGRWEFILPSADGIPRSQFWGMFYHYEHGERVRSTPDPVTGLYPFRDLGDAEMREAIQNLTETYIGNPFDGAGTTRREVMRRYRYNKQRLETSWRVRGEMFADMAAERGHRLRGSPLIVVGTDLNANAGASGCS